MNNPAQTMPLFGMTTVGLPSKSEVKNSASFDHIPLSEVKNSFKEFSGEGTLSVGEWLSHFEDQSKELKWNNVHKYYYGRELMKGAAKIYVEYACNSMDWNNFKSALEKQFGKKTLTHNQRYELFKSQKKLANESDLEYLYKLKFDALYIFDIDKKLGVKQFLDGIDKKYADSLKHCNTLDEVEEELHKLKIKHAEERASVSADDIFQDVTICGRTMHIPVSKEYEQSLINFDLIKHFPKQSYSFDASDVISVVVNNRTIETVGSIIAEVKVDQEMIKLKLYVVQKGTIKVDAIIGKNILEQLDMFNMPGGGVKFVKKHKDKEAGYEPNYTVGRNAAFKDVFICGHGMYVPIEIEMEQSLLSFKLIKEFSKNYYTFDPVDEVVVKINNREIQTFGSITADITVDGIAMEHKFYAVRKEDINARCIIGRNVLEKLDIMTNSDDGTVKFIKKFNQIQNIDEHAE